MEDLQYQLHVSASTLAIIRLTFKLSRDYNLYNLLWGRETRSRFTIVHSMKISTLDSITNIWCQYPDFTCLKTNNRNMLRFKCMLSGVWVAGKNFGCSELSIRVAISYIHFRLIVQYICIYKYIYIYSG